MEKVFRRNGKKIYIKSPQYEEVMFVRSLWSDTDSMQEFGGTFHLTDDKWKLFYKKMVSPTDGRNCYTLVYNYDNQPIGEASFHAYDPSTQMAKLNIKIKKEYRSPEVVEEAIKLILEVYFYEFGGTVMIEKCQEGYYQDSMLNLGFQVIDKAREIHTLKITEQEFGRIKRSCCMKVGVLLFDEFDILSLGNMVGYFENEDGLDIEYLSIDKDFVQSRGVINVNTKIYKGECYDLLLIPSSLKILNYLCSKEELNSILKLYNNCNLVVTCSISNILSVEIFKDKSIKVPMENKLYAMIKDPYCNIILVEDNMVQLEKLIMINSFKTNSEVMLKIKNQILQCVNKK